ncbi:sulfurtransferase complex subunit TusD [Brumicola pallidula]|jgi:tRNA 2-thiouridine synthesizing protein D|uniref:tRNA 2-thiouridine synthesizing protein D n=1 Tax=Brumicola pallidula DSM 14239 = ACAM 615 TaxID=1121922 RepID=K6ZG51_9ALTE|nr:sulfurtransferase complex subunit TusD [Glaciecola pallidula]GAC29317.1 tRNA 2-thiouridine synthesizing protein D [Glaciecola pallidula DSM 14239 = ACAM 615]
MNKFLIFVTRSPFDSLNGLTALSFCEAAIELGHEIEQVFFYQQGVQQANVDIQPATGEKNLLAQWLAFSEQTKTPLNVCVTASIKRGVLSEPDATAMRLHCNVHCAFNPVGMADYFSALNTSSSCDPDALICMQF